jgi:ADP-ribose pyrophosphatase YjhB (NUDIX family)
MPAEAVTDARIIPLRRPPVLNVVPGAFVPTTPSLEEVDRAWASLRRGNARYFDGRMLHVLGVSRNGHGGVVVHAMECAYRFYAVIGMGLDTGVRPLGVKGLAERDGRWLMGRRSGEVAYYPDQWEFVPGGCLEPGVEPETMLLRELGEESGFDPAGAPVPLALLYDPGAFTWEIVHRLAIRERPGIDPPGWEYRELRWIEPGAEPRPLSPVAEVMRRLRDRLVESRGGGHDRP